MRVTRKDFLLGLSGVAVGAPLGAAIGHRYRAVPEVAGTDSPPVALDQAIVSYSQSGEDVVAGFIFDYLKIEDVTYLDIGTYDPILLNNTYYFYRKGHRGVLVEPNVALAAKLRSVRPLDTTLVAGIGVSAVSEADYYVMSEPSWSTFSKEEADHQVEATQGRVFIEEVRKMPLLNVNDVMRDHFSGAPAFVSIDAEGWHLPILQSIDYERFRPKVICVETLVSAGNEVLPEIAAFMDSERYVDRGGSFVNTIFVDSEIL
jgi:hypothetical protein